MKNRATSSAILLLAMIAMTMILVPTSQAVDIQGFDSATACEGTGFTFAGIGQQLCTVFVTTQGSVQVSGLSLCQTAETFTGGGCTTLVLSANGPAVQCFIGGGYTGALWINGCRRRRLQENIASGAATKCTGQEMVPTGVHFTESASAGSWILHTPNATYVLELLRAIEEAEAKVEWLKAQGAHFVA